MAAMAEAEEFELPTLEPQLWQRGIAAGVASAFSSVAMNPLDIVKTRMQAQATSAPVRPPSRFQPSPLATLRYSSAYAGAMVPLHEPLILRQQQRPAYRSVLDGARQIVRHEGVQTLWRGTDAAVLMSVPLVAIYLPLYDHLLPAFSPAGSVVGPLLAGSVARGVAGFATAPLELARVRMQAAQRAGAASGGLWQHLAPPPGASLLQRVSFLWTGLGASLAKDVPFAALYWSMLEPTRGAMLQWLDGSAAAASAAALGSPAAAALPAQPQRSPAQLLAVNITSAGFAGSIAALVTTPFDVAKTKMQTAAAGGPKVGLGSTLAAIWRQGGTSALMTGAGARVGRTAGGYAIVTSMYELFKEYV